MAKQNSALVLAQKRCKVYGSHKNKQQDDFYKTVLLSMTTCIFVSSNTGIRQFNHNAKNSATITPDIISWIYLSTAGQMIIHLSEKKIS